MERSFDMASVTAPPDGRKPETKQVTKQETQLISKAVRARPLFDPEILRRATKESFVKLNPRLVAKNPVMFVVEVGAAVTTVFVIKDMITGVGGLLFDWIKIQITSNPGETFLDRMIALVEGAVRQKTPNEIALNILIAGLTLIFLLAVATLPPYARYAIQAVGSGTAPTIAVLVSLLVCLIPTTIGGLLSAIGIAGMDRVMQHNVLAMSGKAGEAAGDVNTLLLDKTGTITLGNRQAVEFITVDGATDGELADAAQLSSLADETPEGRSIVVLAKQTYNLRGREMSHQEARFIPFSAYTRMTGVDLDSRHLRKGATEAIADFAKQQGATP